MTAATIIAIETAIRAIILWRRMISFPILPTSLVHLSKLFDKVADPVRVGMSFWHRLTNQRQYLDHPVAKFGLIHLVALPTSCSQLKLGTSRQAVTNQPVT